MFFVMPTLVKLLGEMLDARITRFVSTEGGGEVKRMQRTI